MKSRTTIVAAAALLLAAGGTVAARADTSSTPTLSPSATSYTFPTGSISCNNGLLGLGASCDAPATMGFAVSLPATYAADGLAVTFSDNVGHVTLELLDSSGTILAETDHTASGTETLTWATTGTPASSTYSVKVIGDLHQLTTKDTYVASVALINPRDETPPPVVVIPPPSSGQPPPVYAANLAAKELVVRHRGTKLVEEVTIANTGPVAMSDIVVKGTRNGAVRKTGKIASLASHKAVRITLTFPLKRPKQKATYGITVSSLSSQGEATMADNTVTRRR